jgi:hypothetical protein
MNKLWGPGPFRGSHGQRTGGGGGGGEAAFLRCTNLNGLASGGMRAPNWPTSYTSSVNKPLFGGGRGDGVRGIAFSFWMRFNDTEGNLDGQGDYTRFYPLISSEVNGLSGIHPFSMYVRRTAGSASQTGLKVTYWGGKEPFVNGALPLMFPDGDGLTGEWIWLCAYVAVGSTATCIINGHIRNEGTGTQNFSSDGATGAMNAGAINNRGVRFGISCADGTEDSTLAIANKCPIDICNMRMHINLSSYSLQGPFGTGSTWFANERWKHAVDENTEAEEASMLNSDWQLYGAWPLASDGLDVVGTDVKHTLYAGDEGTFVDDGTGPSLL